ncbi:MAG: amidohydrolase family protein [Myxococcota bacterium]|nr:amidohydrolase family protein [Myxococcota bacterium]
MSDPTPDLVIRNGNVVDGTGAPPFPADVAITNGIITRVGEVPERGAEEIDARGLLVTPGFVDIHTHYDGQATWDERMTPSSWHGVTTAVMGNCGVGFAPCRPEDHETLVKLMEGVEDIPGVVLSEGLSWDWETFPEFLQSIEARPKDIDVAAQLPHGPLRVYVMGERAANLEAATPEDIEQMATLAREAIAAGALGFSTSRTLNHRTSEGKPTPTLKAAKDELLGIALALRDAEGGVLQFVTDFKEGPVEMALLEDLCRQSGRPLSVSLAQAERVPDHWRGVLEWLRNGANQGLPMCAQVAGRPVGLMLGLEATLNPFIGCPSYRPLNGLTREEKVAALRQPETREAILTDVREGRVAPGIQALLDLEKTFLLGDPPDYEQPAEQSLAARARRADQDPHAFAYDRLLDDEGRALLYFPFLNYAEGSLDPSFEMMNDANTVLGLGDGGAHLGTICDASFSTHMLTHWTRDRTRGPKLPIETVVQWHTRDTARAVGLLDRGLLAPGYKADVNVIDYEGLTLRAPRMVRDLPADGRRLVQDAEGYRYAIVSGEITYRDGKPTGALPGRLVRGAKPEPTKGASA